MLNHLARRIDVDGLTLHVDPVQLRLHQKEMEHQHRLAVLERELRMAKVALYQYASHCNGSRSNGEHRDELVSKLLIVRFLLDHLRRELTL